MTQKPRTSLFGVDQSRPFYMSPPSRGNMASIVYSEDLNAFRVYDSDLAKWLPIEYIPFIYDFAVQGGATGTINLVDGNGTPITVPANTIILDGVLDVVASLAGGAGASLAIQAEAAGDILATTVYTSLAAGLRAIKPDGTVTNAVKTTVERTLQAVIATDPLTAGKLYGFLRCLRSFGA
jgi:hypothetical protein